jgi:hypothetical protein
MFYGGIMRLPRKKQAVRNRPHSLRRRFILIAIFSAGILFVLLSVLVHQLPENPQVSMSSDGPDSHGYQERSNEKKAADLKLQLKKFNAKVLRPAAKQTPAGSEDEARKKSTSSKDYQSGYGIAAQAGRETVYPEDLLTELIHTNQNLAIPEMNPEIDRILQALVARGEAALPAIRQLLESGDDFRYTDEIGSADLADYDSIRLGLFKVLRQIGGPEAEDILLGELQTTYEPAEINMLTNSLEELAPGKYIDVAVAAARETLDLASEDQLPGKDVGLLFQVLQKHGDATVVTDLKDSTEKWGYYATVTLAGLQDSDGIPVIVDMVQARPERKFDDRPVQSTDIYADKNLFALQMLAQVANQNEDAHEALIEQTNSNRIPDSLWPKIGLALAGQYQFQNEKPEENETLKMVSNPGAKERSYPHIIAENGQVIYIKNRYGLEKLPPEEIETRLRLIDDLLSVSNSVAADRALNHARSMLMANKEKK